MRLFLVVALAVVPFAAQADTLGFPGTRTLGLGGGVRGAATGDAGPVQNPSGMSLLRAYVLEGAYQYAHKADAHGAHVSIVDSTSGFNIAGGVYYTYLTAGADNARQQSGHEGAAALSAPFGDYFFLGTSLKYHRLTVEGLAGTGSTTKKGFTFDVGMTVRPGALFTLGAVGYNLIDLESTSAPRGFGGGVTLALIQDFLIVADGTVDLASAGRPRTVHFMGGAEYVFARKVAGRIGGGRRGDTETGYVTAGASLLAEVGALDFGLSQDVSGASKETRFAVSARLFVPSP